MSIVYKYIDTPTSSQQGIEFMEKTLLPLLSKYWAAKGRNIYNCDMQFNIMSFVQMWFLGSLVLIIAYDKDEPVGFLIGIRYVPILYDAATLNVEVWYCPTEEMEQGLFDYLMTIIRFMNITEVIVETHDKTPNIEWPTVDSKTITRHKKV